MKNRNEFIDKAWQKRNGMPNPEESDNAENNIFEDAGAKDEDLGQVNETGNILPDEDEGDNRFMDNEEEIEDPLETDDETEELEEFEELDED